MEQVITTVACLIAILAFFFSNEISDLIQAWADKIRKG